MNCKINFKNKKSTKEKKQQTLLLKALRIVAVNSPAYLNSSAIDEFLVIFLVAAKANGISNFKNLGELNKKRAQD